MTPKKEKITPDNKGEQEGVDVKFVTQGGATYTAPMQKSFFGKVKSKKDIDTKLAGKADEDMTEEFVTDLFLKQYPGLMIKDPNDKTGKTFVVDPSLNIIFDGNGTLGAVKDAIYENIGIDAEFDVMESDYNKYKSNTTGTKPKPY